MDSLSCKSNSYDGFVKFADKHHFALTPTQQEIARQLFSMPVASGKSTLLTLLFKYDELGHLYLDWFNSICPAGPRRM